MKRDEINECEVRKHRRQDGFFRKLTPEEKIRWLRQAIIREKEKPRPNKTQIRSWGWEIHGLEGGDWYLPWHHHHGGANDRGAWEGERSVSRPPKLFKKQHPARPPHNKNYKELSDALILDAYKNPYLWPVLRNFRRTIQWALKARFAKTRALNLGIIAGVPTEVIASKLKIRERERIWERRGQHRSEVSFERINSADKSVEDMCLQGVAMIDWAWEGRTVTAKAVRLGIIAGVPAKKLARQLKIETQAIYPQIEKYYSRMGGCPSLTALCATESYREELGE